MNSLFQIPRKLACVCQHAARTKQYRQQHKYECCDLLISISIWAHQYTRSTSLHVCCQGKSELLLLCVIISPFTLSPPQRYGTATCKETTKFVLAHSSLMRLLIAISVKTFIVFTYLDLFEISDVAASGVVYLKPSLVKDIYIYIYPFFILLVFLYHSVSVDALRWADRSSKDSYLLSVRFITSQVNSELK
jgi:hypothetical protein